MPTGLYIHIPFCKGKCRYCNFYSVPVDEWDTKKFCDSMITELNQRVDTDIDTIYIGGGSPSSLGDELICLVDKIIHHVPNVNEFTVEVNPDQVNAEMLTQLRGRNVNRLSIGAQSFDDDILEFLGRNYKARQIEKTIKIARKAGFDNISLDLIFAIPSQSLDCWQKTLKKAVSTGVEHISAYSLSFEEDTLFKNMLDEGRIKRAEENIDRCMYEQAVELLNRSDIFHYEISNFARYSYDCKHNLKYWNNNEYIGLGPAAGSFIDKIRMMNVSNINQYFTMIDEKGCAIHRTQDPNEIEFACECAVLGLRKIDGIVLNIFEDKTGYNFVDLFEKPLKQHLELGNMEVGPGRIKLTPQALPIADAVLCDFSYV